MKVKQQCAPAAQKLNCILGSIQRGVAAERGDFPPLLCSPETYLETVPRPGAVKDVELLKQVQK